MDRGNRGVFWLIDGKIFAVPYDADASFGISKSGDNYNHRLLWDYVKPKGCNKPYDYYPRGRVEQSNKGKPIIFMSVNIGEEYIPVIMEQFGIVKNPKSIMTEVSIICAVWIVIRSAGNNTKADVELPNLTAKHRLFFGETIKKCTK